MDDKEEKAAGDCGKIQRSLESMLRQMEVTPEEKKYREENFVNDGLNNYVDKLICTRCNSDFTSVIEKGKEVGVHPLLGVLMCNSCCDYFGDGNFSLDSEGEDKYCRWCGDGGTIFVCYKCSCGFCDACIEKHFGGSGLEEVKNNDNWTCYFCDPKPLWYLRSLCSLAEEATKSKREQLKKRKEGRMLKRRRRKKESDDSDVQIKTSSVTYDVGSNDSSSSSNFDRQIKRRRSVRRAGKIKRDNSSSSDDVKENHINSRSRGLKMKRQDVKVKEESSDSSSKTPLKKLKTREKISEFEHKKPLILDKLKLIWKLTQSVMEAGLSSSRDKVKHLSRTSNFKTFESLKREHEDLKSCMDVLLTSINSASNSLNGIKDDLTFDNAKNETENIRDQEVKLKTLAKKFRRQANVDTSVDSDGNSSQIALEEKESTEDAEEKGKEKRQSGGSLEEDGKRGKTVSESENEKKPDAEKDEEKRDSGKESVPVKPLLKVKSFARMLSDNVYDRNKPKNPIVIDLYNVDTDESENEKQKGEEKEKETSGGKDKKPSSGELNEKSEESSQCEEEKKSETEKDKNKNDEKANESEEETKKNKKTADEEDSKESEEKGDKKETIVTSEDDGDGGKESNNESQEKEKQNSSSDESQKSEEETKIRRTRSKKKETKGVKASFEDFKRKREKFLKSSKEGDGGKEEVKETRVLESSESETEKKGKNRNRKKKRVLASSDEENGEEKKDEDQDSDEEENEKKSSEEESEKENQNGKSDAEPAIISAETTSEDEMDTRKRKRIRKRIRGSSDSGENSNNRKRKKENGNSSDSSGNEETKKNKNRRKNIKKILKKDKLQVETKEALKNEQERRKRLKEKQKLFDELFPQDEEGKISRKLILDFDPETKEPLVTIHKKLAKKLKPHQFSGVKFMWDNCFESVQKLEEESGSGCILAHCMGLGKTLQVVTLVHTVMTHDLGVNTVLIVCPLSTVTNWIREFEMWLENVHTEPIMLYDLVKYKKPDERRMQLQDWHKNGGVLVISYDLFRTLTKQKKERKSKQKFQAAFETALLDPGPDLVVCDEGHLLKNEDTALSKSMCRLKTARRIVLTGTPLQNNLIEYHCMVQFVKPNILGTRKEFCNRFVNPISNGQFEDSTDLDVRIMKRRSYILHSMLEGCVQRFDYSVLTPFLPEKHEYVLLISLTDTQSKAYLHFLQNLSRKSSGASKAASLFNDYHSLQRIWTHPRAMLMQKEREDQREASDSEGSLKDFVVSTDEEETTEPETDSSEDLKPDNIKPRKRILRSNANDPEVKKMIEEEEKVQSRNWWNEFYDEEAYDDMRESYKLVLLFDLLKYCKEMKDKVLVFSQSLYSLDLIEYFLAKVSEKDKTNEEILCGHRDTWILGTDYFRLDGSTSSDTRSIWCRYFNKESNTRARLFLISTRAGGLGINLYGANRVVIFDASWNPSHDLQSIFRVYRFGQKKTCYIYRFLSEATMEEKIYERQVTKLSLAHRVVDEHQIERHYTMGNLQDLYKYEPIPKNERKVPMLPKDSVLADLLAKHKDVIVSYHEHDSLLENKQEEELTEEERKAAWKEYEGEKAQKTTVGTGMQHQVMLMQQGQQIVLMQQPPHSIPPEAVVRYINPAHLTQMGVNPVFVQSSFPPDAIQRGLQVGVTPLPKETLESFMNRVFNREHWLQAGVQQ